MNCVVCGSPVMRVSKVRQARGWGQHCQNCSPYHRRREPTVCVTCGLVFKKEGHAKQKYCSKKCAGLARTANKKPPVPRKPKIAECIQCRTMFPKRGNGRTCSDACRQRQTEEMYREWYSGWYQPRRLESAVCIRCSAVFKPAHGRQTKFCSLRCCRAHYKRLRTKRYGNHTQSRSLSVKQVGERDRWRCHICRKHVRLCDATCDHLIPRSVGGGREASNLALAHRSCNSRRGAGRLPAQLLLKNLVV